MKGCREQWGRLSGSFQVAPGTWWQASPRSETDNMWLTMGEGLCLMDFGSGDFWYWIFGFKFFWVFLHWNNPHISSPSLACNSETLKCSEKETRKSKFVLFLNNIDAKLIWQQNLPWTGRRICICNPSLSHFMRIFTSFAEETGMFPALYLQETVHIIWYTQPHLSQV